MFFYMIFLTTLMCLTIKSVKSDVDARVNVNYTSKADVIQCHCTVKNGTITSLSIEFEPCDKTMASDKRTLAVFVPSHGTHSTICPETDSNISSKPGLTEAFLRCSWPDKPERFDALCLCASHPYGSKESMNTPGCEIQTPAYTSPDISTVGGEAGVTPIGVTLLTPTATQNHPTTKTNVNPTDTPQLEIHQIDTLYDTQLDNRLNQTISTSVGSADISVRMLHEFGAEYKLVVDLLEKLTVVLITLVTLLLLVLLLCCAVVPCIIRSFHKNLAKIMLLSSANTALNININDDDSFELKALPDETLA